MQLLQGNLRLPEERFKAVHFLYVHLGRDRDDGAGSFTPSEREPERFVGRLMENTRYMKEKLAEAGIPAEPSDTPIIPIILGEEEKTLAYASRCIEEGILLSAIRPPTVPAGTSRIRLTVTAAHTKEELDRAVAVMKAHFPCLAIERSTL